MRYLFLTGISVSLLFLFPNSESEAHVSFLAERAYLSLGFGEFQCEGFKDTEGGYVKKNLKAAHVFYVGAGYRFSDHIRSDINFQYSKLNYKVSRGRVHLEQRIRILSGMLNAYYDLYLDDFTCPYVTIGIGVSNNNPGKLRFTTIKEEFKGKRRTNLAWNVGGGILLNTISKDYSIDIGYRYVDFGKIQTAIQPGANYATQKIRGHKGIISVVFKL